MAFKKDELRKRKPIKPKGPAVLDPPNEPQEVSIAPPQTQPVTIQLSGEQLLAIFDGLKLLLAKLSASDPQPLKAIYITTRLIQGLEPVAIAQLSGVTSGAGLDTQCSAIKFGSRKNTFY